MDGLGSTDRIVVIGDLHGDYDAAISALEAASVIPQGSSRVPHEYQSIHWLKRPNQSTQVVQVGDIFDGKVRSPQGKINTEDEEAILNLMIHLKKEAAAFKGDVHLLVGNHEIMNTQGDFRYTSEEGFKNFNRVNNPNRDSLNREGRVKAFVRFGRVREKLAHYAKGVIKINDCLFIHAGIRGDLARKYSIDEITKILKAYLMAQVSPQDPSFKDLFNDPRSIVWLRSPGKKGEEAYKQSLKKTCETYGVNHIFVGHSVQTKGVKKVELGEGCILWLVDSGLSGAFKGKREIVEVTKRVLKIIPFSSLYPIGDQALSAKEIYA